MAEYTKEELRRFVVKDARIILQNALSHATNLITSLGAKGIDGFTVETSERRIKEVAGRFARWVCAEAEKLADEQSAEKPTPAPQPTQQQSGILAKCLAAYNAVKPEGTVVSFERLQTAVWAKYGRYPEADASVARIIVEIPIEQVVEAV